MISPRLAARRATLAAATSKTLPIGKVPRLRIASGAGPGAQDAGRIQNAFASLKTRTAVFARISISSPRDQLRRYSRS